MAEEIIKITEESGKTKKEKNFITNYWREYKLLEKDFIDSADYVTVSKNNYPTFSGEYLKLILCICSEIDSVSQVLVNDKNHGSHNVPSRILEICNEDKSFRDKEIKTRFPFDEIHLRPFTKFCYGVSGAESPPWWREYNELKHNRTGVLAGGRNVMMYANLENTLSALAALCILLYKLSEKCEIRDESIYMKPRLFEII